jgi:hypothetical protein
LCYLQKWENGHRFNCQPRVNAAEIYCYAAKGAYQVS